jgi:hypothetical protein
MTRRLSIPLIRFWASSTLILLLAARLPAMPAGSAAVSTSGMDCQAGLQILFYSPHPLLEGATETGFSDSIKTQLRAPLEDIGYCLQEIRDHRSVLGAAQYAENLVLHVQIANTTEYTGGGTILIALLKVTDLARGKLAEALSRPLVTLPFQVGEVFSLTNILVKKITENLRSQYVADIHIRSNPPGARVRTLAGLEGKTPVEWVMPLGISPVTLEKTGYLSLERNIDLTTPGMHTFDLQMAKRRFYHSKFIYPALASGAISLAAFALENHFYSKYLDLGREDLENRPDAFGKNFRAAKTYERIAYTSLGLAWLNLVLCFTF